MGYGGLIDDVEIFGVADPSQAGVWISDGWMDILYAFTEDVI